MKSFFDRKAPVRSRWLARNKYYHMLVRRFMKFHIPAGSSVLEIGCGTGHLLNALSPRRGVGIDFSSQMVSIASSKYPHLEFICADAEEYVLSETFDFIVISDTVGYFQDIQKVLKNIQQNCRPDTRVIITTYNHLWEPLLKFGELSNLKMAQPFTNWLTVKDICGLLYLENFDVVKTGEKILLPIHVPFLSYFCNRFLSQIPLLRKFCLMNFIICRQMTKKTSDRTVSVVVPARNEAGNIEKIVKSIPRMGRGVEIIFIEGGSTDNTWEEIKRVAKNSKIAYAQQSGIGKGDAVRKGFDMAKGDILMIYDADRTVPARDLPKFYEAIVSNKGEFINGSRLVYPMEKQAMRTLNLFGNKMFSMTFSWLLNQRIKDTLCGTKVISKKNYDKLKQNRKYFGDFDPFGDFDLLFGASKLNLKIVEIPVRYQERTYGSTNIRRFAHGFLLIRMCLFALRRIKFV